MRRCSHESMVKVCDKSPKRNVDSWNVLIAGHAQRGSGKEALQMYEKMQQEGIEPNLLTFVCTIKACSSIAALGQGKLIHAHILKRELELDLYIGSSLVGMYAKWGWLEDACKVFKDLPVRNVFTWSAMIAGYTKHGCGGEALQLFENMQQEGTEPDIVIAMSILKACSMTAALEHGKLIHAGILKQGFESDQILGNTIIDMYAKCRSVADAWKMFNKLPVRNVASWSIMIAGYVDHGDAVKALQLFKEMHTEGIEPNKVTFLCILKACSSIATLDVGKTIHSDIIKHGLDADLFVGSTLIDMYAKCTCIEDARKVFDILPAQNVVTWSIMIAGYSEHGHNQEALHLFKKMQWVGIKSDKHTFLSIIKACASPAALHQGKGIHTAIMEQGLESDPFVGSSLVAMYVKCGSLDDADRLFNKISVQDIVTWTAMIAGYAEHGYGERALKLFDKMVKAYDEPDEITFVALLKACSSITALNQGKLIHCEIIKRGIESNIFIGSCMVDMYAKCGYLDDAHMLFNTLLERNVVSWNAIIGGYADYRYGEEAFKLFKEMQQKGIHPDKVTFLSILKACCSEQFLNEGKLIHACIIKQGLQSDPPVGNSLIDMYAGCDSVDDAHKVFDSLPVQDVVSWTAIILAYSEHGSAQEALHQFKEMQEKGIQPNEVTYIGILKACSSLTNIDQGKLIHVLITKQGLESDLFIGSTLIDMYAKCGSLGDAHKVFEKLQTRNVVSWSAMIAGYANCGHDKEVVDLFEKMQLEGVEPNQVTFVSVLQVFSSIGALDKGKRIHIEVLKRGIASDIFVGNTLVGMYAKCGSLEDAQHMFNKLQIRDVVSWNAIIAGFADHGHCKRAQQYFELMHKEGIEPDGVTFVCLLSSCSHAGQIQEGQRLFESMRESFEFIPTLEHHVCMVDILGRSGLLCEAENWILKMPFEPDSVIWMSMLGSCAKFNNMDMGRRAFDCIVKSASRNVSAYAVMSNIYSANGMCLDAKL